MWGRVQQVLGTGAVTVFVWLMIFLSITGRADDGPPLLSDFWSANIATAGAVVIWGAMWRLFAPPEDRDSSR